MKTVKIILPLAVMLAAIAVSYAILVNKPAPPRKPRAPAVTSVEAITLARTDYQVWVESQGTVTPRTESTLIPEVAGRIIEITPAFREGAFFEAGQLLLRIDPRNYQIAVTVARSKVAETKLALIEEQAKSRQAEKNWQRLGQGGQPSELVLRKPQLAGARAALASAEAQLEQAELDQQRTRIVAPYAGRILEQQVDVGQYVSPGSVLAKIYAVDYAEIRLPLSDQQLQFVDVPELYRGQDPQRLNMPEVELSAAIGRRQYRWRGRIVRAEGAYDTRSRRLSLVAQVDDPYRRDEEDKPPLKVGQFVDARIEGRRLNQVFVIPRAAIRDNTQVLLVSAQNRLVLRRIEPIWRDAEHAVVRDGLQVGELLCITPVPYAVNGLPVRVLPRTADPDSVEPKA